MKNLKWLIYSTAIVISFSSCFHFDDDGGIFDCVKGTGDTVTETLDMPMFNSIKLDISADVIIEQGDGMEVKVEGQANVIELIELDVQNDTWEIEFNECVKNHDDLKIFVTMPDIKELRISGSGVMTSTNFLEGEDIELKISGSGDMDLGLNYEEVKSKISGSGKIRLEGETEFFDVEISGSGDVRAFDFKADKCEVQIKGSGDVEVFVEEELDIKISGSGDVFYKGNPLINVDITGSGDVIDAN